MSLIGVLSSNLFAAGAAHHTQNSQKNPSDFQQFETELQQLGQDLKSGDLRAAQQDYANIEQDVQQASSQQVGGRYRLQPRLESSQSSSSQSSQQANPIAQAFRALAQDLQAGNLSAAQSAFATLQNDLQQIGGFLATGSNGNSNTGAPGIAGSLNVTA